MLKKPPLDKTKREHFAKVSRVIFSDPEQPFAILGCEDEQVVVGAFDGSQFERDQVYRFLGYWEDNAQRGPRFRASTYVLHSPGNRTGVIKYLQKTCDLTESNAGRLWEAYGSEAIATLRDKPREAVEKLRLSHDEALEASVKLKQDAMAAATKIELHELFSGRGFQGKLIDKAIKKWGRKSVDVIKRNPFALMPLRGGAGFKRCDSLWRDLGLPSGSLKRQAYVAWQLVSTDRIGHTWISALELATQLRGLIPQCDAKRAFKLAIRAKLLKVYRDSAGATWLAAYSRGTSEERIAANVQRLNSASSKWPTDQIPVSQSDGDNLPSQHQVDCIQYATGSAVGLFLGGPGTGKTHTVAYLLRAIIKDHGLSSVLVCAPTGKAAVRVSQALEAAGFSDDFKAKTIHSTLEIGRNGHDGEGWGFTRNRNNPLQAKFIVVDESSMIDADLMADLLEAVPTGANILFVGDPYQLPPVGHGAPLRDFIAGGLSYGELTEVRRNAGQIVHACQKIKNNEDFETADRIDLDSKPPKNLKLIEADGEKKIAEIVELVLKSATLFHPVWQTQVICARNKGGELGRTELNKRLKPLLNPDGYSIPGNPYSVNDKVICLRNSQPFLFQPIGEFPDKQDYWNSSNYQTVYRVSEFTNARQPAQAFVANGETGRVEAIGKSEIIVRFSKSDDLVKMQIGKQSTDDDDDTEQEDKGSIAHAYAVTCHKLQGSESPCVVIVGDDRGAMVTGREWLYTAVSRASKLCVLVGNQSTFQKMAARQSLIRRKTFVAERLRALNGQEATYGS